MQFLYFFGLALATLATLQANPLPLPPPPRASVISCTLPPLCLLAKDVIAPQTAIFQAEKLFTGDPHDVTVSAKEIKQMLHADLVLLANTKELPWMRQLEQQLRQHHRLAITLELAPEDLAFYQSTNTHALAHFWAYPTIACRYRAQLLSQLKKLPNRRFALVADGQEDPCPYLSWDKELKAFFSTFKGTIILSHDALGPLLKYYQVPVISLKSSQEHGEVSAQSLKLITDLPPQQLLWIKEANISLPSLATKHLALVTTFVFDSLGQNNILFEDFYRQLLAGLKESYVPNPIQTPAIPGKN